MRRHDETDSQSMREYYESYMREVPCQVCHGRRLKPEVLAVTVDGKSIFDVCDMPVVRELAWINGLKPVSYTHLDVYKRQPSGRSSSASSAP